MSLWFVTCHFNPAGYRAPVRNYHLFADALVARGAKLLTVELAFGDRPFELEPGGEKLVRIRGGSVLWQKERLLNHGISLLPAECDQVCWTDADLLWDEDFDLVSRAEDALERYDVVQMFERLRRLYPGQKSFAELNPEGYPLEPQWSFASGIDPNCAVGGAWAARREVLADLGGLYDRAVMGGGDSLFCSALRSQPDSWGVDAMDASFDRWAWRVCPDWRFGCLPVSVCHLYHGSIARRGYEGRHLVLQEHAYDPEADVRVGDSGALEWASDKPGLHAAVAAYFSGRREDTP